MIKVAEVREQQRTFLESDDFLILKIDFESVFST